MAINKCELLKYFAFILKSMLFIKVHILTIKFSNEFYTYQIYDKTSAYIVDFILYLLLYQDLVYMILVFAVCLYWINKKKLWSNNMLRHCCHKTENFQLWTMHQPAENYPLSAKSTSDLCMSPRVYDLTYPTDN